MRVQVCCGFVGSSDTRLGSACLSVILYRVRIRVVSGFIPLGARYDRVLVQAMPNVLGEQSLPTDMQLRVKQRGWAYPCHSADTRGLVPGVGTVLAAGVNQILNVFQPSFVKGEGKERCGAGETAQWLRLGSQLKTQEEGWNGWFLCPQSFFLVVLGLALKCSPQVKA